MIPSVIVVTMMYKAQFVKFTSRYVCICRLQLCRIYTERTFDEHYRYCNNQSYIHLNNVMSINVVKNYRQ